MRSVPDTAVDTTTVEAVTTTVVAAMTTVVAATMIVAEATTIAEAATIARRRVVTRTTTAEAVSPCHWPKLTLSDDDRGYDRRY